MVSRVERVAISQRVINLSVVRRITYSFNHRTPENVLLPRHADCGEALRLNC